MTKKICTLFIIIGLSLPAFASMHNYISAEKYYGPDRNQKAWVVRSENADQYGNMKYMYLACKMTGGTFVLKHQVYVATLNNFLNGYTSVERMYNEYCL